MLKNGNLTYEKEFSKYFFRPELIFFDSLFKLSLLSRNLALLQAGCRAFSLQISEFFDHFFKKQKMKLTAKIAAKILGISDKKWDEKINQNRKRKKKGRQVPKNELDNLVQES